MATYKVLQDIEAEDKLLGPLSLRQFVYAAIVVVLGFINFKLLAVNPLFTIPLIFPIIFFGLLAAPFGHDQSSEVWLLAKIRFMLKPRKRIWDQDGMQELVTITVPKKIERQLTKGLSQHEVTSRLHALANTLDSRGWAVKNVNVNMFSQPSYLTDVSTDSDRLVDVADLPQDAPSYDVAATDDIMDEKSNPTAQHLEAMIRQSAEANRQHARQQVTAQPATQEPADYWFMNQPAEPPHVQPGYATFSTSPVVAPGAVDDPTAAQASDAGEVEQNLLKKLHEEQSHPNQNNRLKTLRPIHDPRSGIALTPSGPSTSDDQSRGGSSSTDDAEMLRLATNDDLNVATIAREANRKKQPPADDEVVVSLR